MSRPQEPEPTLLVAGLLHGPDFPLDQLLPRLEARFGPVGEVSEALAFDQTDYYVREMGPGLLRRLVMFERLVDPGRLPEIKLATNAIEDELRGEQGFRRVNVDPGLLSAANFILATGKGYTHRPYLGSGIYADLTLLWSRGGFVKLPWTYPDYAGEALQMVLTRFRGQYLNKLRAWRETGRDA